MNKSKKLSKFKSVKHAFFNRLGGKSKGIYKSLNCGIGSSDTKKNVLTNLNIALRKIGAKSKKIALLNQIHSNKFFYIDKKYEYKKKKFKGDALITNKKKLPIGVLTADCAPILIHDQSAKMVAAIHAGWRGAYKDIIKNVSFWNLPNILIITLKRFSIDGKHKRNEKVDFPLDLLDLSKYVCGYKPQSFKYELYAICNHSGNVYMGHYTSFIKNYTNNWYLFDDENIQKVVEPKKVITPMAYCLFYRKKK